MSAITIRHRSSAPAPLPYERTHDYDRAVKLRTAMLPLVNSMADKTDFICPFAIAQVLVSTSDDTFSQMHRYVRQQFKLLVKRGVLSLIMPGIWKRIRLMTEADIPFQQMANPSLRNLKKGNKKNGANRPQIEERIV
jgi:hypothetical protein